MRSPDEWSLNVWFRATKFMIEAYITKTIKEIKLMLDQQPNNTYYSRMNKCTCRL